jgi:predicted ArsR family transcriptional regulator
MFEAVFGNATVEKVLLFLYRHKQGYPKEIADRFDLAVNAVQQQLKRLELGNVVVNRQLGRTRMYEFNPRYPLRRELENLLEKAFSFLPKDQVERFYTARTRPRRPGKTL